MKTDKNNIIINLLPFIAMVIAILPKVLIPDQWKDISSLETVRIGIITLLLTLAATFYIRFQSTHILEKRLSKTIITTSYLGSIVLLVFIPYAGTFSIWMLGGLLVSMLVDQKLGLLMQFNLCFMLGIVKDAKLEQVIQLIILSALMILLSGALKSITTAFYAMIIILSSNITLSFVINSFVLDSKATSNYLNSLFAVLVVLVSAYLINSFYEGTLLKNKLSIASLEGEEHLTDHPEIMNRPDHQSVSVLEIDELTKEEELPVEQLLSSGTKTSYDVLCDLSNELLRKLQQYSESLYDHALLIGNLSYLAAKEVGANELLAKAGGLYHEIGKLNGKNYIEEGIVIAEDYSFPKELKAILKEHNIKYDKPSSIEAAIVMLSDNVVSTIEYIEKSEDHKFTTDKIIDNLFQMRMEKGTFDKANLSLKEYKTLKEFYQKEFRKQLER